MITIALALLLSQTVAARNPPWLTGIIIEFILSLTFVVIPVELQFNLVFVTESGVFFSIFEPDACFSLIADLHLR